MARNIEVPAIKAAEASTDDRKPDNETGVMIPWSTERSDRRPQGMKRSNYADRIRISVLVNLENSMGWRQGVMNLLKEVPY